MAFEVSIGVFEGPFDLLLQLIMRQELDIHDVPVARITSSYLEQVKVLEQLDLDSATEFLVIAATLLLIKARSLLGGSAENEDLGEAESPEDYLAGRLIEYRKFQQASEHLERLYRVHGGFLPSFKEMDVQYASLYPDPFEGVGADRLGAAMVDLITGIAIIQKKKRILAASFNWAAEYHPRK